MEIDEWMVLRRVHLLLHLPMVKVLSDRLDWNYVAVAAVGGADDMPVGTALPAVGTPCVGTPCADEGVMKADPSGAADPP